MIQFTNQPKRGDAVVGDIQTQEVLFVRQDTLTALSDIDQTQYEIIGVVIKRRGQKVLIAYKENASKQWCNRYSFKLTGYTLDGTDRTGTLNIRQADVSSWGTSTAYTISYNATTVAQLVEQLNTYFQANAPFTTQDWVAIVDGDGGVTLQFSYVTSQQASYNSGSAGFTLTANLLPGVPVSANMLRRNGFTGGEGAISSWERALAYFRADNSSTNYNPNSNVTSVKRGYPICLPGYLGTSTYRKDGTTQLDYCAALRAVYGEGEAGWLRFMQSCLPVSPTDFGEMGKTDVGLAYTKTLAALTMTKQDGTTVYPCQAAKYCHDIGTGAIPQGKWYLPTARDVRDILDGIQYGTNASRTADAVNKTLNILGGSAISNGSYWWSCLRYSASSAWSAHGNFGFFSYYGMVNSIGCVPVSLYTLRQQA